MRETDNLYALGDGIAAVPLAGRVVFRVTFDSSSGFWVIRRAGETVDYHKRKVAAVLLGRQLARQEWKAGRKSQLVVHGKSGRIQFEWTYGADPERSRG